MRPQRIAMIGAFDPDYTRHAVIRSGLEAVGVTVDLMAIPKNASTVQRARHLITSFRRLGAHDAVLIPAFNQMTLPLAWALGKIHRMPVLADYMTGLLDVMDDRGSSSAQKRQLYRAIDRFNISRVPAFTDTDAHRQDFARRLGLSTTQTARLGIIPVGVRQSLYEQALDAPPADRFIVQFLGTYIPFHGVDVILQAAQRLRDQASIHFELIGSGQTYAAMQALAASLALDNVTFIPGFYGPPELLGMLGRASVYLGVFGDSDKTRYVVPSKVYESAALGRAVITADAPALHEFFTAGEHLLLVPPGDPVALADAIAALAADPDQAARIGAAGRAHVEGHYLPQHIGAMIREQLSRLLEANHPQ